MRPVVQGIAAVALVGAGVLGARSLLGARPHAQAVPRQAAAPLVEVVEVRRGDHRLVVRGQGTVRPATETTLVAEVDGRVVWTSKSLVDGGFFRAGDTLLRLDPRDLELAVVRARARVAEAELREARETAAAEVAREEWAELGTGPASPLTLREPQVAEARAQREAAEAELERARRDLDRAAIRAPHDGRVLERRVTRGQFVVRGSPLALVHGIEAAEVRVPVPTAELAHVDLPLGWRPADGRGPGQGVGPRAVVTARIAGRTWQWRGRVVRTEGELDPSSRMVHAVVEVADPHGVEDGSRRPPLTPGLFVDVAMEGGLARDVAVLPRAAFRTRSTVLVVGRGGRLESRTVEVLREERDAVVVSAGVEEGELAIITPLDIVSEGMAVRVLRRSGTETDPVEQVGS